MGLIKALRGLPREERAELPGTVWRLILLRLLLCLLSIRRILALTNGAPRPELTAEKPLHDWHTRARAMKKVASRIPGTTCLVRALTLRWWMRANGFEARLRIGVRNSQTGQTPDCHAWVEFAGEPVDELRERIVDYCIIELEDLPQDYRLNSKTPSGQPPR